MSTEEKTERKKPGRVAGPETKKYNVLIEEELAEWGKREPGGLSELVRRLLKKAREEARKMGGQDSP
jgi:hypothetical protein